MKGVVIMAVGTYAKGGDLSIMASFFSKLRARNQITLAPEIVKTLHLDLGDELEFTVVDGKLIGTPKMTIDKDQSWYFTSEWQEGEREAEDHLKHLVKTEYKGLKKYASVEEALSALD
jgi:antitoxin component of MazEF toxin-antitoxin module